MEKIRQQGQALTEYVILLAIVVSIFSAMMRLLASGNAVTNLQKTFTEQYARTYRYGHPEARGQDDGGPLNLPLYQPGDGSDSHNFRIFINPPKE
jgi:hypothetical protein